MKGLKLLQSTGMAEGLPTISDEIKVCQDCLVGKQSREPFPKMTTLRATQKLELIHSDLCGSISPASSGNKRYILSIIDDYSRKMWVYFMVEKSEAFTFFKHFKSLAENEAGTLIKCLRTYRGGEFNSHEFN